MGQLDLIPVDEWVARVVADRFYPAQFSGHLGGVKISQDLFNPRIFWWSFVRPIDGPGKHFSNRHEFNTPAKAASDFLRAGGCVLP